MSKTGISPFDRLLSQPLSVAPDFQVLLAALSARQGASPTARIQTLILQDAARGLRRSNRLVSLFADGKAWANFALPGCFSPAVAALITSDQQR